MSEERRRSVGSLLDAVATAVPIFASRLLLEDATPSFVEKKP